MRRVMGSPWFYPALFVATGLLFLVTGVVDEKVGLVAGGVIMAGLSLMYVPALRVRSRPFAGAQAHVDGGGVVVFWRPGCRYCLQLIKELEPERRARGYWVNIWQEPAAAAFLEGLHERREGKAHQAVPTAWTRRRDYVVASEQTRARLADTLAQQKETRA